MKRKYLYVLMACMTITLGIGLSGCGSTDSSQSTSVSEVSDNNATNDSTSTGASNESTTTTPEDKKNDAPSQASPAMPETENGSQMTLGTIQSVDIDNNTVTISVMQGFSGFNLGSRPDGNGQPGELPEGLDASDFQGQVPGGFNGQVPDDFDASDFQGKVPGDFNGQVPGDFDASDFQDKVPGGSEAQVPDGAEVPSQRPGGNRTSGESKTYTVTEQTVIKNQDGNVISISDLSENTFVQFTAEDDVITSITVNNGQGGSGKNPSTT